MTRATRVLCCGLVALGACSGQFRFDNSPEPNGTIDAAVDQAPPPEDVTPPPPSPEDAQDTLANADSNSDAPLCETGGCRFRSDDCPGVECKLSCSIQGRCADSCGTPCTADCEQRSTCILSAGDRAHVRCEQDAACAFNVGNATVVECWARASCQVQCSGTCTVDCDPTATCFLGCGAGAPRSVTGQAGCP